MKIIHFQQLTSDFSTVKLEIENWTEVQHLSMYNSQRELEDTEFMGSVILL